MRTGQGADKEHDQTLRKSVSIFPSRKQLDNEMGGE